MMPDQNETALPESPVEMASWVRDRSMKIVEELTRVVEFISRDEMATEELQSALYAPISAALANAIKLAAFSSGHHLGEDELSVLVGAIYSRGPSGFEDLLLRLSSLEEPVSKQLHGRH